MPFSEFDPFSGRVRQSRQLQPLYPILPNPLDKREAPKIMFGSNPVRAADAGSGPSSPVSKQPEERNILWERFKRKRALLEAADPRIPMYLRLGLRDRIFFGISLFGLGIISIPTFKFAYDLTKE